MAKNNGTNGNAPVAKFRLGLVSATVWRNNDFYNIKLAKSYQENEVWKETDYMSPSDLQSAREVLQKACDYVMAN